MSNQREELHNKIWQIAESIRGDTSLALWESKDYLLTLLFYKFISDKMNKGATELIKEQAEEAKEKGFDITREYKELDDEKANLIRDGLILWFGYYIPPSALFDNVLKRLSEDFEETKMYAMVLRDIFNNIELSTLEARNKTNHFNGLFDAFKDISKFGKTLKGSNKIILNLLWAIANMELKNDTHNDIDTFGDAYEYLIGMYAKNGGKLGGEYFTPQAVGKLLSDLVIANHSKFYTVYDPTCGSGGLLLSVLKNKNTTDKNIMLYGQELNSTTYNLARMNMFLHNISYDSFEIVQGNTLTHPAFKNNKFDIIVSNPPYSVKWDGVDNNLLKNDERFLAWGGLAPKNAADFAFVQHSLSMLRNTGKAAIVCLPTIFYRKGQEQKIRKALIEDNVIETIIALPPNLFYGTSIATYILVINKVKTDNKVLFINTKDIYTKATNENTWTDEDIKKIMDIYAKRETITDISYLASLEEIRKKDYDLAVTSYVIAEKDKKQLDINRIKKDIDEEMSLLNEYYDTLKKNFSQWLKKKFLDKDTKFLKLDDVCIVKTGKAGLLSKKYIKEHKGNYPVYSSATLNDGVIGNIDTYDYDGQYLTCTVAGVYAGTVFYRNGKFSVSGCALIDLKEEYKDKIDLKYLYYYLTYFDIGQLALREVSSNAHLRLEDLKQVSIPIIDISKQQEMVQILNEVTRTSNGIIKNANLLKENYTLRKEYLTDKYLNFENKEVDWTDLRSIVIAKHGSDRISKKYMKEHPGNYPVYSSTTLNNGVYGRINSYSYDGEYLTISRLGQAGKVFYINNKFSATDLCYLITIKDDYKNKFDLKFLYYWLNYFDIRKLSIKETSSNAHLTLERVNKSKIPLIPLDQQNQIASKLDEIFAGCKMINTNNTNLANNASMQLSAFLHQFFSVPEEDQNQ